MTINEIQDELINDFELFDDWTEKYAYIIELGKKLGTIEEEHKKPENIIKGCQSNVWLIAHKDEKGKLIFRADSDAIIVKGLVYMLLKVLSGHSPKEITDADLYFMDKIGMSQHLSPTRSNGLVSMMKQMKFYAIAYQSTDK
jgi:cysteine desulfuration protein SufE